MRRIWVDTDIALGGRSGDVDDGFALAAVALAERACPGSVELAGVSIVSGNTDADTAQRAARMLLDALGGRFVDVPVVPEGEAPRALASLSEGTSVLAIGPPTNLVQAAAIDPALPARVDVRAVGTVLDRLRHPVLPMFCLNFRTDPEASRRFFALPWRARRMFPLDVVRRLRFGREHLDAYARTNAVGAHLAAHSRRWVSRALLRYGSRRFVVWDLVAAMDAIGHLPGAKFSDDRLTTFDAAATERRFFALLEEGAQAERGDHISSTGRIVR